MSEALSREELLEIIRAQQESIDRLVRLVERQAADRAGDGATKAERRPKPAPVDWFTVSGPDRLAVWQSLALFVESIVVRYNLQRDIRPCWWLHAPAVEELTALWHMRQAMYGPDTELTNATQWQVNLNQAIDRVRHRFVSCKERHVDSTTNVWMSDDMRREFAQAIRQDAMMR